MNLISCENCGGVLDRNRIYEPYIYGDDDEIIREVAAWDGDAWFPTIECPVCRERIFYHDGGRT